MPVDPIPTPQDRIRIDYDDDKHIYWVNGELVPGATGITGDTMPKDALGWWGMRVGMAAVVAMMRDVSWAEIANAHQPEGIIDPASLPEAERYYSKSDRKREKPKSIIEAWTTDNKRTVNHILDEAAERGTDVHTALEMLGIDEVVDIGKFPPLQQGYVAGLLQWFLEQEPEFEENEVIVGSAKHRFAGRFDTIVRYPHRPEAGRVLTDAKTSKGVYFSHIMQLPLYRLGYHEMGFGEERGPIDTMEVLHLGADGTYTLVPSLVQEDSVVAMVHWYHAQQEEKARHRDVPGLRQDEPRWKGGKKR